MFDNPAGDEIFEDVGDFLPGSPMIPTQPFVKKGRLPPKKNKKGTANIVASPGLDLLSPGAGMDFMGMDLNVLSNQNQGASSPGAAACLPGFNTMPTSIEDDLGGDLMPKGSPRLNKLNLNSKAADNKANGFQLSNNNTTNPNSTNKPPEPTKAAVPSKPAPAPAAKPSAPTNLTKPVSARQSAGPVKKEAVSAKPPEKKETVSAKPPEKTPRREDDIIPDTGVHRIKKEKSGNQNPYAFENSTIVFMEDDLLAPQSLLSNPKLTNNNKTSASTSPGTFSLNSAQPPTTSKPAQSPRVPLPMNNAPANASTTSAPGNGKTMNLVSPRGNNLTATNKPRNLPAMGFKPVTNEENTKPLAGEESVLGPLMKTNRDTKPAPTVTTTSTDSNSIVKRKSISVQKRGETGPTRRQSIKKAAPPANSAKTNEPDTAAKGDGAGIETKQAKIFTRQPSIHNLKKQGSKFNLTEKRMSGSVPVLPNLNSNANPNAGKLDSQSRRSSADDTAVLEQALLQLNKENINGENTAAKKQSFVRQRSRGASMKKGASFRYTNNTNSNANNSNAPATFHLEDCINITNDVPLRKQRSMRALNRFKDDEDKTAATANNNNNNKVTINVKENKTADTMKGGLAVPEEAKNGKREEVKSARKRKSSLVIKNTRAPSMTSF
ncbi:nucleolar and coiled-body phosphoprotein 1 [Angomonas deanei]|uniref:Uncharacterized protein n=1 Tax=Angomonas deanei TaxID=59799 RepID=A0A7G2C9Z4_9TRYP|nr:nucleolar and coiled-body phosphoprotein 1 [Angomonas deanei]CAD2216598.1 hypothetical protein, conserved [Angomonas deanei]|eukprot:EPY23173.1 nucleolar and coiled-body phosphoprotein 1 [Angomonas deanei]